MSEQFPVDSVITVGDDIQIDDKLFWSKWFMGRVRFGLSYPFSDSVSKSLVEEGMPCKMLAPGQEWRTGYIRVRVEFVPGELPQEQTDQQ